MILQFPVERMSSPMCSACLNCEVDVEEGLLWCQLFDEQVAEFDAAHCDAYLEVVDKARTDEWLHG